MPFWVDLWEIQSVGLKVGLKEFFLGDELASLLVAWLVSESEH